MAVAAAGGVVVAALANGGLLRWRSDGSSAAEVVEVPKTKKDDRVVHLALDGTGSHAVLSLASGEHWYVHASVAKARKLVKWQGAVVSSVAFHTQSTATTTKALLVATAKGQVFETVLDVSGKDRAFTQIWKTEQPISALFAQSGDAAVLSVLVCTAPPSAKVYHFRGAARCAGAKRAGQRRPLKGGRERRLATCGDDSWTLEDPREAPLGHRARLPKQSVGASPAFRGARLSNG